MFATSQPPSTRILAPVYTSQLTGGGWPPTGSPIRVRGFQDLKRKHEALARPTGKERGVSSCDGMLDRALVLQVGHAVQGLCWQRLELNVIGAMRC